MWGGGEGNGINANRNGGRNGAEMKNKICKTTGRTRRKLPGNLRAEFRLNSKIIIAPNDIAVVRNWSRFRFAGYRRPYDSLLVAFVKIARRKKLSVINPFFIPYFPICEIYFIRRRIRKYNPWFVRVSLSPRGLRISPSTSSIHYPEYY